MKQLFITMMAIVTIAFASCSKDDNITSSDKDVNSIKLIDPSDYCSSVDSLKNICNLNAYIYNSTFSDLSQALVNRMRNKFSAIDSTTDIIIINNSVISSLSTSDYKSILDAYLSNASFIILDPTENGFEKFFENLSAVCLDELDNGTVSSGAVSKNLLRKAMAVKRTEDTTESDNDLIDFCGQTNPDEPFCKMIFVGGKDLNYVSLPKDSKEVICETTDSLGNVISSTKKEVKESTTYTAYQYGLFADYLVDWLNEQNKVIKASDFLLTRGIKRSSLSDNTQIICDDASCISTDHTLLVNVNSIDGTNLKQPLTSVMLVRLKVWPIANIDKNTDYYIIKEDVRIDNMNLSRLARACGDKRDTWTKGSKDEQGERIFYGPYFKSFTINNTLTNSSHQAFEIYPKTDDEKFTYSNSSTLQLSGNLGFMGKNITGGLSGSVSFTESTAFDIKDISLAAWSTNDNPGWELTGHSPKIEDHWYWINPDHDIASRKLIYEADPTLSWIWKVDNSNNQKNMQYIMHTDMAGTVESLTYMYRVFRNRSGYEICPNNASFDYLLPIPNRAIQHWRMFAADKNNNSDNRNMLVKYLKEYIPNYWKTTFDTYDITDSSFVNASLYWSQFKTQLDSLNNENSLKDYGVPASTYTITMENTTFSKKYSMDITVK